MNYYNAWSDECSSGNRYNTIDYFDLKSSETLFIVNSFIPQFQSKSFADIGCGAGELLYYIDKKLNITTAIDYSEKMLDNCKFLFSNTSSTLKFINAGLEILPELSESTWISTGALSQYSNKNDINTFM